MSCNFPKSAYQRLVNGEPVGELIFGTLKNPKFLAAVERGEMRALQVPCGQCMGCRLKRRREWAVRLVHEAQCHEHNCFLTLTYAPEHLPANGSLVKDHPTKFLKRLREHVYRKYGTKIRYFLCGEYGEKYSRPHYHVIIFGFDFPDRKFWKRSGSHNLYRSALLEQVWTYGFSSIGAVTYDTASYTAGYVCKKILGRGSREYYEEIGKIPEYVVMSRRPGLGTDWITRYLSDVYPVDKVRVQKGRGVLQIAPPRFYDRILEKDFPELYNCVRKDREERLLTYLSSDENSHERLSTKEKIAYINYQRAMRSFEKDLNL